MQYHGLDTFSVQYNINVDSKLMHAVNELFKKNSWKTMDCYIIQTELELSLKLTNQDVLGSVYHITFTQFGITVVQTTNVSVILGITDIHYSPVKDKLISLPLTLAGFPRFVKKLLTLRAS